MRSSSPPKAANMRLIAFIKLYTLTLEIIAAHQPPEADAAD